MAGRIGRTVYRTKRWKRLRIEKLTAENWRCEDCGHWANEVHHRVPLELGGDPFPPLAGLKVVCRHCHIDAHWTDRVSLYRIKWRRFNRHRY